MADSTAQPWRWSPTRRPNTKHSAAGIRKMLSICTKLDSAVGFSYGCAELALKKPPPLVPTILMASCEATGPMASVWVALSLASVFASCPSVAGVLVSQVTFSTVWTSV